MIARNILILSKLPIEIMAYTLSSILMDPLGNIHCLFKQRLIIDILYPNTGWFQIIKNWIKIFLCAILIVLVMPFGSIYRFILFLFYYKKFIYKSTDAKQKILTNNFTMLSWNVCCIPGGYAITDGGITPWSNRIDWIIDTIKSKNADIICLQEIFDIQTANILTDKLGNDYCYFYVNIGPKLIGLSSGLFVASKFNIDGADFYPFGNAALNGRAKFSNKGFFYFSIASNNNKKIGIYATHLQHSEIPAEPTKKEIIARQIEMDMIIQKMSDNINQDDMIVLTGDLNMDDNENEQSDWYTLFDKGIVEPGLTWGGDYFCAGLTGRVASPAMNLDHTMVLGNSDIKIKTSLIETGFDSNKFKLDAMSDHKGLFSNIEF